MGGAQTVVNAEIGKIHATVYCMYHCARKIMCFFLQLKKSLFILSSDFHRLHSTQRTCLVNNLAWRKEFIAHDTTIIEENCWHHLDCWASLARLFLIFRSNRKWSYMPRLCSTKWQIVEMGSQAQLKC